MRDLLLCALFALLIGGCAYKKPAPLTTEELAPFLKNDPASLSPKEHSRLYADFLQKRYTPWLLNRVDTASSSVTWAIRYYEKRTLFGENRLPLLKSRWSRWIENLNYDALNRMKRHAVTIRPSNLRLFPSERPIFFDPSSAGEGYPFDYNQNSAIKAFTPLLVSHLSRDGGWAFVQTPFALGWLKIEDIAFVSQKQIDRIMKMPMVTVVKEGAALYDGKQNFLFYAKTATLFPLIREEDGFYRILVPKEIDRQARFEESLIPLTWAKRMPLSFDRTNIALIASGLLGEPYGWGGVAQDRDCSAMTRDFFAPFGIWLPRNSKAQAKVGKVISLKGLSKREKERMIIKNGIPFLTLVHLPGHIMLYVGTKNKNAYVMHNIWGIRTEDGGRYLIAKAVITRLDLGMEIPEADKKSLPIERIDSMNIPIYPASGEISTSLPRL